MTTLNQHEKLIRKLTRDHNATIKRLEAARDICNAGTNSYRQYEESIASERRAHIAALVKFGVVPTNLGAMVTTEFLYVAFSPVCPANREELAKVLGEQMQKAAEGLHYSEQDEAAREQLRSEFK